MNKILVTDLNINHSLCDDLSPAEREAIWGGGYLYNSAFLPITTIQGDVNTVSTTYEGAGSSHDNKIDSIDYSKSTYVRIRKFI